MELQSSFSQLESLLTPAQKIVILVGTNNFDGLTAGVSLGLSLEASGKQVGVFAAQQPKPEASFINGLEKVKTDFGQKDLTISFDYPLESIEKVSSQEEADRLRLVVKIKPGSPPIKENQVKIAVQNAGCEVGIVIGEENAFSDFSRAVSSGKWIWLGKEKEEKNWAQASVVDPDSSYAEIAARIIQGLGLPMDRIIGGNLFEGIKRATASFGNLRSYKTLETAALCFKLIQGSRKQETERKEDLPLGFPTPRIFKGATTPRL